MNEYGSRAEIVWGEVRNLEEHRYYLHEIQNCNYGHR